MITFSIPGRPVPQERRIHIRGQWAFDPPKSRKAKEAVKFYAIAARAIGHVVSEKAFAIEMRFYGPHWGADVDNLAKLVMDGLKGVFWKDDHQVTQMHASKFREVKGGERTVVTITEAVE